MTDILAGLFSLGGSLDVAVIEALIQFDSAFDGFSFEGVPDVRVIVFKGFPVMAMMRLSTAASDGKANLHQGAVGVGIDITTGKEGGWSVHEWTASQNPFMKKKILKIMDRTLKTNPNANQLPSFRRMYLNEWVID